MVWTAGSPVIDCWLLLILVRSCIVTQKMGTAYDSIDSELSGGIPRDRRTPYIVSYDTLRRFLSLALAM